jgi:hypothetical protein
MVFFIIDLHFINLFRPVRLNIEGYDGCAVEVYSRQDSGIGQLIGQGVVSSKDQDKPKINPYDSQKTPANAADIPKLPSKTNGHLPSSKVLPS